MATKTLGTNGGLRDFTTVAASAAYYNTLNFTAPQVLESYNDGELSSSGTITFGGWTGGSATNTLTFTTGAGQSFVDNANRLTNLETYDQANGVGIRNTDASGANFLRFTTDNFILEKVQILQDAGSGGYGGQTITMAAPIAIRNVILKSGVRFGIVVTTTTTGSTVADVLVQMSSANALYGLYQNGKKVTCNSVQVVLDSAISAGTTKGVHVESETMSVTNVSSIGFGTCFSTGSGYAPTFSGTNNASSDATAPGTSAVINITAANQFQSSAAPYDYRLKAGSGQIAVGTSTGAPAADIVGTSWGGVNDIGCWKFVAASGSNFFPAIVMGRAQSLVF